MDEITQLQQEVAVLQKQLAEVKQSTRAFAQLTMQVIDFVRGEVVDGKKNVATELKIRDLQMAIMNMPV